MKIRPLAWMNIALLAAVLAAAPHCARSAETGGIVVIANPSVPHIDAATLRRLYTGRAIEVNGMPVTVVNAPAGSATRQQFLSNVLQQDEDQYRAYWTVRQHVGKGAPPRELQGSPAIIEYVQQNAGAIGYIDATDLKPGMNVVQRP